MHFETFTSAAALREHYAQVKARILRSRIRRIPITDLSTRTEIPIRFISSKPQKLELRHILKVVEDHYKIVHSEMMSARKMRHLTHARQVFCRLAYELTTKSLMDISRFIGRDHTTVLYSIRKLRGYELQELRNKLC